MKLTQSAIDTQKHNTSTGLRQWIVAALIILTGVLMLLAIQTGLFTLSSRPSGDIIFITCCSELAFYIWVRVYSRMKLAGQAKTLAVFIAIKRCLYAVLRHDGFTGDGRLIISWRWAPSAEKIFNQSRTDTQASISQDHETIDLTRITFWDYPGFRGADRMGIARPIEFSTDWERFPPKLLWRKPIGRGWSSFAVVGNYCITQ